MDFYEILGIPRDANAAQVRSAYARLARERHPDRFPDPDEKRRAQDAFTLVTAAFNTLSNQRDREAYDAELAQPKLAAPAEIAQDAFERGCARIQEKDFHEAVSLFRTAVHHVPDVARYHRALGQALARNPNWVREGMVELETAARLDPKDAGPHVDLARIFASQGLKLRARRSAETALRLSPRDPALAQLVADLGEGGGVDPGPGPGGLLDRLRRK